MTNNGVNFIVPNDKSEINYIGFDILQNCNRFVFPPKYFGNNKISDQDKRKEARKIITLLKKFRQEYFLNGNCDEFFQFNAMIWLIQDYINHGYYVELEQTHKIATNGKINWKQTIKHNSIFFENENIIYRQFVRNRTFIDDSQILTQIYKSCLYYSVERLGFIFGVKKTENSIFDIEKDKDYLLFFLYNELDKTFNDYKKTLLMHLIAIIKNQNLKNKYIGFSIFDNEFEYVFEFLVNKIFGTENVKNFYNTYSYYLPKKVSAPKLRPDTILKDNKNQFYYIIDAKYYNFGYSYNPKNLPESSSISKQIGYNHYLRDNKSDNFKVKSVFILPFASNNKNEIIKYVGYAQRDDNNNIDDRISICLVDLKTMINAYTMNKNYLLREKLIEILTEI